jgi:hypothetical protein
MKEYSLRPTMSIFMDCAAPAMADPAANMAMEPSMTTLLPKMSLSPPEAGMEAAEARPYALPIQMKSGPSRSLTIVGKAVPTLVSSRALRKSAVDVPTNNKPVLR